MHRYLKAAILLLVLLIAVQPLLAQRIAPEEAVQAAKEGMERYIKTIPRTELVRCGLPEDFAPAEISVGPPLKVLSFDSAGLADGSADTPERLLRETDMWFFPVLCRGQYVSILTVDFHRGAWRAVGLGKAALSREIQIALNNVAPAAPHIGYLARHYQLEADFLVFKVDSEYFFYLLHSARLALGRDPAVAEQNTHSFNSLLKLLNERAGAKEE